MPSLSQMEKIKRANNLWTSDSLFLRPTLSIPIDKQSIQEDSLNSSGNSEQVNGNHLDRSPSTASSSNHLNGNGSLNSSTSSSTLSSSATPFSSTAQPTAASKEHNNNLSNLDYKISLNDIQPDLADCDKPSTSGYQPNGDSSEMLKAKDESMDDFLSRIDQYIATSKVKMDSFANTSEIIISSKSDDNIFQHLHNYNSRSASFRQHSLRNNDICLGEIRDKSHNHENREIVYSLRKLEKEQEEREKYEL